MREDLTELQTKLAFQDDTLQSLNQTVIRQQQEIQELKLELTELKERLQEVVAGTAERKDEPPPPHY
jgi:SlyX protein